MIAAERIQRISRLLETENVVSIAGLSQSLNVSAMTIRRDLVWLEKMGLCERTHGGAVSTRGKLARDIDYSQRQQLHVAEKVAIGRAAAEMVEEGETIAIDAGTTTAQLAAALHGRRNITVVTNSLRVLDQLCDSRGVTVISTGGTVAPAMDGEFGHGDHFLVGSLAEATMRQFRPSKAFMGTTGLTIADGLSNSVPEQAALKRVMMEVSAEVVLLADHSKFGRVASAIAGPVTLLRRVIADDGISPQMKDALEELAIKVVTVAPAITSP